MVSYGYSSSYLYAFNCGMPVNMVILLGYRVICSDRIDLAENWADNSRVPG